MNRTELFKERRKGIAKTEYVIMERLNDLSEQIEALSKRLDDMSEQLYYYAKTDREDLKNAFDEMFDNPIKEIEEIFKIWKQP